MKDKIEVLFNLIQCALFDKELDEETKKFAAENSEILFKMSRHHDAAHLVQYAFKKSGTDFANEQIKYEFLKQQVMSVMRYEDQNLALTKLSALFEDEKIPFIPLKGAVIRSYYPEPWMRTSCDIDILVHEDDLERAVKSIVKKLGYKTDGNKKYHDISLYSDTGVHLELHFNIKENMEKIDGILEKVWDYAKPEDDGAYEYKLSNEFLMFQIAAHLSYHVAGGGCGIRNFSDLFLLEKKLEYDKEKLDEMLEEGRIKTFYDIALRLTKVWFSDEKNDEITYLLQQYILNGGIYGTRMNLVALHRHNQSKFSYVLKRIFMPYDMLVLRYPNLKGKRYLVPYYQIKRWCSIVADRRIKYSVKELAVNNGVTDDKTDSMVELLQRIGLDGLR